MNLIYSMNPIDTESLLAFEAVAKTRSFSLAAKQLFLTQPAVSKRISKLEEQLNHRLFDRMGRDLKLTEAGLALLPKADLILRELRETERSIRELSGEIVGTLNVATSHHIGLHHLPPILRQFAAEHPNVNLQFEFLDSEKAHQRVIEGECELAIVTLAPVIEDPLTSRTLWTDPLAVVVARDHELAKLKRVNLKNLCEEPAILPDLNTFTGRLVKQAFENEGLDIRVNMATNYLETIKMMVSVGLGWSVLPLTLADDQITTLEVPEINVSRELGIVSHKRRSLSNAARAFQEILDNTIEEANTQSQNKQSQ